VIRLDPTVGVVVGGKSGYAECPYNYGDAPGGSSPENIGWLRGVLEVPDQCYRPWSLGLGANMQGDLAMAAFISYAPKMDSGESGPEPYLAEFGADLAGFARLRVRREERLERQKHFFRREPGIPLRGPTVWTFDHTGELREKDAVISGAASIHGLGIDEDGKLYFACSGVRISDGVPFLAGRGGNYGGPPPYEGNRSPITGVYMKTRGSKVRFITRDIRLAPMALQEHEMPRRPHDILPSEAAKTEDV
jgi:hypothetical protein